MSLWVLCSHYCGDHTFGVTDLIRVGGKKVYTAAYDLQNEFGEIVLFLLVSGKSMGEVSGPLRVVAARSGDGGQVGQYSMTSLPFLLLLTCIS